MIPKPVQRARRLIRKYGYESPDETDLIDLLYAENLNLKYETTDDYQGKIVFNKYEGIITLSNNLENEYQKRYVIAHEMGHFFNERALTQSRNKPVCRQAGSETRPLPESEGVDGTQYNPGLHDELIVHEFKRDRYHDFIDTHVKQFEELKREKEANQFAVELLMKRGWVREIVGSRQIAVGLVKELAEEFRVSLTAAALRYAEGKDKDKLEIINDKLGAKVSDKKKAKNKNKNVAELYKGAMAVILSVNKRIEWMACNKNFAYGKLKKYEPIPLNTRTYDVYDKLMPNNYVKNQRIKRTGYKQFLKEQND